MKLIDADACWDRILNGCCYTTEAAIMSTQTVDPVHFAGGCYCKECEYHDTHLNFQNTPTNFICYKHDGIIMPLNGFCSEGVVDETNV